MVSWHPFPTESTPVIFRSGVSGCVVEGGAAAVGVSQTGENWWRDAGAMAVCTGRNGGLVNVGNPVLPVVAAIGSMRWNACRSLRDAGCSPAEIARRIGRYRSMVCRELTRNSNRDGDYHALLAHARAAERCPPPKVFKLKDNPLCADIERGGISGLEPQLIADVLGSDHRGDRVNRVSHETIYRVPVCADPRQFAR